MTKERGHVIRLKSRLLRFVLAIISIAVVSFICQFVEIGFVPFWIALLFLFPIPLAVFGRWPPKGYPGIPFDVLSPYQKFERLGSEVVVALPFVIALLFLLKLINFI